MLTRLIITPWFTRPDAHAGWKHFKFSSKAFTIDVNSLATLNSLISFFRRLSNFSGAFDFWRWKIYDPTRQKPRKYLLARCWCINQVGLSGGKSLSEWINEINRKKTSQLRETAKSSFPRRWDLSKTLCKTGFFCDVDSCGCLCLARLKYRGICFLHSGFSRNFIALKHYRKSLRRLRKV